MNVCARALCTLLLCLQGCSRCAADPPSPIKPPAAAEPAGTDALLIVDGLTITFGDVASAVDWLDQLRPADSRRVKMLTVIEELTLPMLMARREFAAERQQQLERAQAMRKLAGNVVELEQQSRLFEALRRTLTPRELQIPMARFLFDPQRIGAVSDPIELPQGFALGAAFELIEGGMQLTDRVDSLQVAFFTHDAPEWRQWLTELRSRLRGKLTYFHPDFRDAIPRWLQQ